MKNNRPLRIVDLTDEPNYEHLVEKVVVVPYDLLDSNADNCFEFKVKGLRCLFKVSKSRCCYENNNKDKLTLVLTHDTQEERDTCFFVDSLWQTNSDSVEEYQEYANGEWHNVEK